MSDPQNVSTVMEAAAQAAGAGDFVSAERELRRAFALQEAALGSSHPDLANTLNNLGVVAERLNKPVEAERCYRRAYAIATSVLQPDHPFVVMSAKNLRDFCEARGIPFEPPDAAAATASGAAAQPRASWPPTRKPDPSPAAPVAAPVQTPSAARPAPSRPPAQPDRIRMSSPAASAEQPSVSPRTIAIAAVVLGAIVVAGLWTMRSAPASQKDPATPPPSASSAPVPPATEPAACATSCGAASCRTSASGARRAADASPAAGGDHTSRFEAGGTEANAGAERDQSRCSGSRCAGDGGERTALPSSRNWRQLDLHPRLEPDGSRRRLLLYTRDMPS